MKKGPTRLLLLPHFFGTSSPILTTFLVRLSGILSLRRCKPSTISATTRLSPHGALLTVYPVIILTRPVASWVPVTFVPYGLWSFPSQIIGEVFTVPGVILLLLISDNAEYRTRDFVLLY